MSRNNGSAPNKNNATFPSKSPNLNKLFIFSGDIAIMYITGINPYVYNWILILKSCANPREAT